MPIHDWTRADAGSFHHFHQDWTMQICRVLNRGGILPAGFMALADLKVGGTEPDVAALKLRAPSSSGGGTAVAVARPRTRQMQRVVMDEIAYARKANRIVIKHQRGDLVAAIEVVSPGNKSSKNGLASFLSKMAGFLRNEINVVVIDLFPPGPRDPHGLHHAIWDEFAGLPSEQHPADKPLTIASYDADELTAYVDPVAVGDPLPDAPLFLAPGWYVNIPLEQTYQASWAETPQPIRDLVA